MTIRQMKFGTDGWRGVIADDFTFDNVRIAAAAIANYVLANEDADRKASASVTIRALDLPHSPALLRRCRIGRNSGALAARITPTPALSYAVRESEAAGGVMITSSHNPSQWNGVKYKAGYGGSGARRSWRRSRAIWASRCRRAAHSRADRGRRFLPPVCRGHLALRRSGC